MMDNNVNNIDNKQNYRNAVNSMGKKEFTLIKMQEYGFWPENLPTPYERQKNETPEEYEKRKDLLEKYEKVINDINDLYKEKEDINNKLKNLRKKYDDTWDYEKIRKDVSQRLMKESIERRKEVKRLRAIEKKAKSEAWKKHRSENIVYIGRGYSKALFLKETDVEKLENLGLPIINDDKELAQFLGIEYKQLRYLTYHRDVVRFDNYTRYTIPKKKGGVRNIAAPKETLKNVQRRILDEILSKIEVSECAHGFIQGRSVVSGAKIHENKNDYKSAYNNESTNDNINEYKNENNNDNIENSSNNKNNNNNIENSRNNKNNNNNRDNSNNNKKIELLINMDLENFFPTITFERVRGMFQKFGYSGYVSSLLAMICTYCERMEIEVKGEKVYVKTTDRILPQGSPVSPMITNIICSKLDKRLSGLASKYDFTYSRYADDMSFSFAEGNAVIQAEKNSNADSDQNLHANDQITVGKILGIISKIIREEGFNINSKKTKFLRENNRQVITGIVINNGEIGVPKKWVKNLRAAVFNASKLKECGSNIPFDVMNEIKGMAAWLSFVNKEKYSKIIGDCENLLK